MPWDEFPEDPLDEGDEVDDDGTDEVDVGAEADFVEGRIHGVRVGGTPVVVARIEGKLHAVEGVCTHMSVLLEEGDLDGCAVRCPRHFATFDLRTGEALEPPATGRLATYAVRVVDGRVLLSRPQVP